MWEAWVSSGSFPQLLSPVVLSQNLCSSHPSHETAPFHPVFHPAFPRNPGLLLLHPEDKAGPGHGTVAELLLGPDSGELPLSFWGDFRRRAQSSPTPAPPQGRALKDLLCWRCFSSPGRNEPFVGRRSPLAPRPPALPTLASTQPWLRPFVPTLLQTVLPCSLLLLSPGECGIQHFPPPAALGFLLASV